jgi:hypothetical protein
MGQIAELFHSGFGCHVQGQGFLSQEKSIQEAAAGWVLVGAVFSVPDIDLIGLIGVNIDLIGS